MRAAGTRTGSCTVLGAHRLSPEWDFPGTFLGGAGLQVLTAACLAGMVSDGAEVVKEVSGADVLKPAGKACALEETSTAVSPPRSPAPGAAWGGRSAPSIVKDVNPEVLRSGVACLPGE